MRYFVVLGVFLLMSVTSISQEVVLSIIPSSGKSIKNFIPNGFDTLAVARGDLNKDKFDDIVLVIRSKSEDSFDWNTDNPDSVPTRILVVLLKKGDFFEVAVKTNTAILGKWSGGIFGDPFAGINIAKGILNIDHYGGSSWRWSYLHKFRYQQNDFYLIGETTSSYQSARYCEKIKTFEGEYFDINYVTGEFERKEIDEGCKLITNKKGKEHVDPLKKLTEFTIEN